MRLFLDDFFQRRNGLGSVFSRQSEASLQIMPGGIVFVTFQKIFNIKRCIVQGILQQEQFG